MSTSADKAQWSVLQRVILPTDAQTDTVSLYVDAGPASGIRLTENDELARSSKLPEDKLAMFSSGGPSVHYDDIVSRHSMSVRAGEQVSFGTYFNAFPASYWRRWTDVRSIRLEVKTQGDGAIIVSKSNARGSIQRVDSRRITGSITTTFDLDLAPFGDGGWYWFDVVASHEEITVENAQWLTWEDPATPGQVTLEITTMNKPDFCLNNARILAANPDSLAAIKEIIIVDQGTQKVRDFEGFNEVRDSLAGKLRVIDQANLGGSGGFARGMYEAIENGSDYVLLLDDDVVVEPESILRMLAFADRCMNPTIVGGHMFDLHNRSVLHTFGEVVDPYRIIPSAPHADMTMRHDFSVSNLRQTSWLHRRIDVDYNGWWMCMIPTAVLKDIGLSLPLFIKWDDAEYGLRAREAGYFTVSLPGAAVWHVSWLDKDDMVGWQSYFHERNRLITTLIHSPYPKGGRVIRESVQADVKHLVSMQYFTEHGRLEALRDIFLGPEQLHRTLATKLPEINALRSNYADAQVKPNADDFPAPKIGRGPTGATAIGLPRKKDLVSWGVKTVTRQLIMAPAPAAAERPQTILAHRDSRWFRLAHFDSVVVTNAEGTGMSWYRRDRKLLRSMLAESARLHLRLVNEWDSLAERYRNAVAELSSVRAWKETFDKHSADEG